MVLFISFPGASRYHGLEDVVLIHDICGMALRRLMRVIYADTSNPDAQLPFRDDQVLAGLAPQTALLNALLVEG